MLFFEPPLDINFSQGWVLTALLSLLCVLGCFIIFLDNVYYFVVPKWVSARYPFQLKENYAFMNGSLAFSSGCLLLTALYRLLPEATAHFKKSAPHENYNLLLLMSFIGGIVICGLFNQGLHMLTTESVVHCSHDGEVHEVEPEHSHGHSHVEEGGHSHDHHDDSGSHNHSHNHDSHHNHTHNHSDHTHNHTHNHDSQHHGSEESSDASNAKAASSSEEEASVHNITESSALLAHNSADPSAPPALTRKKSLIHFLAHGSTDDEPMMGECKGYTSAELCHYEQNGGLHFCEVPQFRKGDLEEGRPEGAHMEPQRPESSWDSHSHHKQAEHHHHHVNSPMSRLLLIGIQTILAITLHKFPEGFITYITLKTNPQLGLSIFLSLLIHNYTEGFLMCLPLYYSFGESKWRKWKAVGISAVLGGFSQPAGAFVGYLFMAHLGDGAVDVDKLNYVFGVSMAMTAGFLTVIALSMYGSAVSFSGLPNYVCIWSLLGMCLICLSTIFTNRD